MLTCNDIDGLIDAYIDAELPSATLLQVARHGESCARCQAQMQSLTSLSHMVGVTVRDDVRALDLSGVWAAVERRIDADLQIAPPSPSAIRTRGKTSALRGPMLPLWGTAAMIAASAVLYFQPSLLTTSTHSPVSTPDIVASSAPVSPIKAMDVAYRPKVSIERIRSGKTGAVQVRSLPKDGTTAIWVSYSPDGPR